VSLRVAVTRALPEAERTAERIRTRGHEAIVAPLLTIVPCGYDTNIEGAQALLFTSIKGVRAFPHSRNARDVPVLTVGDATAEAARATGFTNVRSADGDATELVALAKATLQPAAGKLVHVTGDHVAGDIKGALEAAGFTVDRRVAYASVATTTLPEAFAQPLDLILFHSARAAETFTKLGAPNAQQLACACLSAAVAETARKAPWTRIIVAPAPREDALLTAALSG
jgi:uroporphyrinogen-III synthase